jgi:hypothetical protein
LAPAPPAPEHDVGAGCDGRDGVDLHERESLDGVAHARRTFRLERLRAHGDASRLLDGQLDDHAGDVTDDDRRSSAAGRADRAEPRPARRAPFAC